MGGCEGVMCVWVCVMGVLRCDTCMCVMGVLRWGDGFGFVKV